VHCYAPLFTPDDWLQIVRMAMAHFSALTEHIRIAASTCVACFVLESSDGLRVVAMGSGTGYYADEFAPQDPSAELVVDGHAEVQEEVN
jgi:hypothetical protein